MAVPLFDITAQNAALADELRPVYERVFKSGHFILGPDVDNFEAACAQFLGVKHAIGVSSGSDALILALMTLGIGPSDEVLCPSFTFFATAGAVARLGARPVFVDASPVSYNLNVEDARAKITPKTKAIIPVHLYGQAAEMESVMALAKEFDLKVVEDACQSLGATYAGKRLGTIGHFGTYSFFPTKNLGGFGDGGLLTTDDDKLAERARILRMHGSQPKYYHHFIGGNFRLDALQAALLNVKLPHLPSYCQKRRDNAQHYLKKLGALHGVVQADYAQRDREISRDGKAPKGARLVLPAECPNRDHIWNQFTVRVVTGPGETNRRDALRAHLIQQGIGAEIYYPVPLHKQSCFADMEPAPCPVCDTLALEVLSLPIFPELKQEQLDEVIGAIASFLK